MRRRKVGTASAVDVLKGGTGASHNAGTQGKLFGRLRKVGGGMGNVHQFTHAGGPTMAGTGHRAVGGLTSAGPTPHFDQPMGSHKRHRKVGGPSGMLPSTGNAYVGPGGMNGSSA